MSHTVYVTHTDKLELPKHITKYGNRHHTFLGRVVRFSALGVQQIPIRQVRVKRQTFNKFLNKYFAVSVDFWALDKKEKANLGDMVLITPLKGGEKPPSIKVMHEINRIVFKHGLILDPVTKKRVIDDELLEDIERRSTYIDETLDEGWEAIKEKLTSRQQSALKNKLRKKFFLDPDFKKY